MKLPDANVLIYAQNADLPQHARCRRWLETALSGNETIGFSWLVIVAFVRLTTSVHVLRDPLSSIEAIDIARGWLEQPCAATIEPGPDHLDHLGAMLGVAGMAGRLTTDAHLAAIASELGATVVSCDTDFLRFPDLRVFDPTR